MEQEKKKRVTKPKALPIQEEKVGQVDDREGVELKHHPVKDVTVEVFEHPTVQFYGSAAQEFIKKHNIYKVNK